MTWFGAFFVIGAFLLLAHLVRVPARAAEVVRRGRQALDDLRSPDLSELGKEKAMQAHAGSLFALFFVVAGSTALAVGVPVGLIALLDAAGLVNLGEVLDATVSWPSIAAATVIAAGLMIVRGRRA